MLAIHGKVRSLLAPNDPSQARTPSPGSALVGLNVVVAPSATPIEPAAVAGAMGRTTNLMLSY